MSRREATLAGGFMATVGAVILVFSLLDVYQLKDPTSTATTSKVRFLLAQMSIALFGAPAGYVVYNLAWALGGAGLLYLGVKILQSRASMLD